MIKTIILAGLGVLIIFFLFLFIAMMPKYSNVSKKEPFKSLIKEKLTTKRACIIALKPMTDPSINKLIIEDGTGYGIDAVEQIYDVPVGTEFKIKKVEFHTGRVSGTTSAYLFGELTDNNGTVLDFEFTWGHYHSLNEDKPYWTFDQSFWQEKAYDRKFYIPVP